MAVYLFRCQNCGPFDAAFPIGTAPARSACPDCAALGARVITAPLIGHGANGYRTAIDRSAASADSPQVITGRIPGPSPTAPSITRNPLHAKLPRP